MEHGVVFGFSLYPLQADETVTHKGYPFGLTGTADHLQLFSVLLDAIEVVGLNAIKNIKRCMSRIGSNPTGDNSLYTAPTVPIYTVLNCHHSDNAARVVHDSNHSQY